jgi:hypothetical protein
MGTRDMPLPRQFEFLLGKGTSPAGGFGGRRPNLTQINPCLLHLPPPPVSPFDSLALVQTATSGRWRPGSSRPPTTATSAPSRVSSPFLPGGGFARPLARSGGVRFSLPCGFRSGRGLPARLSISLAI